MVAAVVLALAARGTAADAPQLVGVVGVAGVALMAAGLVLRRSAAVTAGIAALGVAYGISLAGKGLDPAAGLFAGGLVLVAELAFWALEPGAAVRLGRVATARRVVGVSVVVLGAALLGTLLLEVASSPLRGDAAAGVAGVAAIGAIAALGILLARSLR